jgi:hypothetical protein
MAEDRKVGITFDNMAEDRKKVLLNFELKCSDLGQKRIIKAIADFNPDIPNSLVTNYSAEYDESESSNIIQQLSDGGIQVAKTGKSFELRLETDNFEFTLDIKPKFQRHWGQSFVEKMDSARKRMGYGIANESEVS